MGFTPLLIIATTIWVALLLPAIGSFVKLAIESMAKQQGWDVAMGGALARFVGWCLSRIPQWYRVRSWWPVWIMVGLSGGVAGLLWVQLALPQNIGGAGPQVTSVAPCDDLERLEVGHHVSSSAPSRTIFSSLSNTDLRGFVNKLTTDLMAIQNSHESKLKEISRKLTINSTPAEVADVSDLNEKEQVSWRMVGVALARQAQTLEEEMLFRLNRPWPICSKDGPSPVAYIYLMMGQPISPRSNPELAGYLTSLSEELP